MFLKINSLIEGTKNKKNKILINLRCFNSNCSKIVFKLVPKKRRHLRIAKNIKNILKQNKIYNVTIF